METRANRIEFYPRLQHVYQYIFEDRAVIASRHKQKEESVDVTSDEVKSRGVQTERHKIEDVKKLFSIIPLQKREQFLLALRAIKTPHPLELLLKKTEGWPDLDKREKEQKVSSYSLSDENAILEKLKFLNQYHKLIDDKELDQYHDRFIAFFKLAKIIGDFVELSISKKLFERTSYNGVNEPNNETAFKMAYIQLALFGKEKNKAKYFNPISNYLKQHKILHTQELPFYYLFIKCFDKLIPSKKEGETIHLEVWRDLIMRGGINILQLFAQAAAIEKRLGAPPKNSAEVIKGAALIYDHAEKNFELARVCARHLMSNDNFQKALSASAFQKPIDYMPDLQVLGKDVDCKKLNCEEIDCRGYAIVKLPFTDPHSFVLGSLSACCMQYGKEGARYLEQAVRNPNACMYILLKSLDLTQSDATPFEKEEKSIKLNLEHYRIVGAYYSWLSADGNLVIDSCENVHCQDQYGLHDDAVVVPMFKQLGKQLCDPDDSPILRVTIGLGGKTPKSYKKDKLDSIETLDYETTEKDSWEQAEIYCARVRRSKIIEDLCLMFCKETLLKIDDAYAIFFKGFCSYELAQGIKSLLMYNEDIKLFLRNQIQDEKSFSELERVFANKQSLCWSIIVQLNKVGLGKHQIFSEVLSKKVNLHNIFHGLKVIDPSTNFGQIVLGALTKVEDPSIICQFISSLRGNQKLLLNLIQLQECSLLNRYINYIIKQPQRLISMSISKYRDTTRKELDKLFKVPKYSLFSKPEILSLEFVTRSQVHILQSLADSYVFNLKHNLFVDRMSARDDTSFVERVCAILTKARTSSDDKLFRLAENAYNYLVLRVKEHPDSDLAKNLKSLSSRVDIANSILQRSSYMRRHT